MYARGMTTTVELLRAGFSVHGFEVTLDVLEDLAKTTPLPRFETEPSPGTFSGGRRLGEVTRLFVESGALFAEIEGENVAPPIVPAIALEGVIPATGERKPPFVMSVYPVAEGHALPGAGGTPFS